MSRNYDTYLQDILEAIHRIESYVENVNRSTFEKEQMRFDAVIRNLEIIGEAVTRVPKSIQKNYPNVSWREIVGFRNRLIHAYFDIDIDIVWDAVQSELPILKTQIQRIIKKIRK